MIYIVMGVTGSGKTTIGEMLAKKLALPFFDADHYHPGVNKNKMQSGIPLTDEDRHDWLHRLYKEVVAPYAQKGAVLACSALKERYRQVLQPRDGLPVTWIFLKGSETMIRQRLAGRTNHFMHPQLLQSQFEALEEPHYGLHIDIGQPQEKIIDQILNDIRDGAN